jgi:hypothetical protein
MLIQIEYIHPADLANSHSIAAQTAPRKMLLNEKSILFINKESVQVQSVSRFTQEFQLIEVLPPPEYCSVFLSSAQLPCIFVPDNVIANLCNDIQDPHIIDFLTI